jgi:DNA-binding response OmpR family regulator
VQRFLHSVLKLRGYDAISVGPHSALDLMKTSHPCVELVITNNPGMFLPFADRVPVLYVAACPDRTLASRFRSCEVLQKPFHPSELLKAIEVLTAVS